MPPLRRDGRSRSDARPRPQRVPHAALRPWRPDDADSGVAAEGCRPAQATTGKCAGLRRGRSPHEKSRGRRMEQEFLDEIRSKFAGKVVAMPPMYPREPRGMDMIEKVSQDLLFGPAL